MSGYREPHAVDVPVLDLDDPDDDILFLEQNGRSNAFLNSMDYENPGPSGWMSKITSYFNTRQFGLSYELTRGSESSDFFDLSDDDADNFQDGQPRDGLRDYKIKRLNQKLNKVVLGFSLAIAFLVVFVFFGRGNSSDDLQKQKSPLNQKRILSNSTHEFYPSTILVSLDGFHPHYINAENTPTMHRMMVEDYGAPYMVPSFPSSTFPNHWTLVTGLYPSEHGIVGNTFYDPKLEKQFINTNPKYGLNPEFWLGGEPVWTTAFRQGVKLAVHMWPGSEVPTVGDNGPLYVDSYNGSELLSSKVDRVMGWLDVPTLKERPELILTYVPTIDQYGHKFGISGQNLTDALHYVDDFVALMVKSLEQRNLTNIVNLVIVSDHGMAPTSKDRLLFLDDVVNTTKIEHIDGWPLFGLRPRGETTSDEIYSEIKGNIENMGKEITENFNVYKVEDIPKEWNFGGQKNDHAFNYRLAPVWIIPNVGYSITTRKQFKENNNDYYPKGVHGYNNTHLLMRAIFLGKGPYFSERLAFQKKVRPFANTEVYGMICDSLNIVAAPNNGSKSGSDTYAISSKNTLPSDWSDDSVYPGLPFKVEHVVRNATYDLLYRKNGKVNQADISVSSNKHPYESIISEEMSLQSVTSVSLPKPSDFLNFDMASVSSFVDESADESESESGFGKIVDGLEEVLEDAGDAVEGVIDDVIDVVGSFFGSDEDDNEN